MNKLLFIILILVFCSCTHEYDPNLRGQWQLKTRTIYGIIYPVDTVFYAFDNRIVCIRDRITPLECKELFMEFTQINDSLILVSVDDPAKIKPSERYKIEEITSTKLRLTDAVGELVFRKF